MGTHAGSMTTGHGGNGDTTAREVHERMRDDIAATRARMGVTLDQLHAKLNPEVLKEHALDQFHELKEKITTELRDAKDSMKAEVKAELAEAKAKMRDATIGKVEKMVHNVERTAKDTGSSMVDTIRANPLPVAMTGLGLAWLFMSARGKRGAGYDDRIRVREVPDDRRHVVKGIYDQPGDSYGIGTETGDERVESFVDAAKHKAGDVAEAVKDKAEDLAHGASDLKDRAGSSLGRAGHAIGDKASYVARGAKTNAMKLERNVERMYTDNPFVLGAAMMVAGVAVGMALPGTAKENEWLGSTRERFVGKARAYADDAIARAGEAAERATDEVAAKTAP